MSEEISKPSFLFHGTSVENAEKILREGIKAQVGQRTWEFNGRKMPAEGEGVWLTDRLGAAAWYALNQPANIVGYAAGAVFVIRASAVQIVKKQYGGEYPIARNGDEWDPELESHNEYFCPHSIPPDYIHNIIWVESINDVLDWEEEYEKQKGGMKE